MVAVAALESHGFFVVLDSRRSIKYKIADFFLGLHNNNLHFIKQKKKWSKKIPAAEEHPSIYARFGFHSVPSTKVIRNIMCA